MVWTLSLHTIHLPCNCFCLHLFNHDFSENKRFINLPLICTLLCRFFVLPPKQMQAGDRHKRCDIQGPVHGIMSAIRPNPHCSSSCPYSWNKNHIDKSSFWSCRIHPQHLSLLFLRCSWPIIFLLCGNWFFFQTQMRRQNSITQFVTAARAVTVFSSRGQLLFAGQRTHPVQNFGDKREREREKMGREKLLLWVIDRPSTLAWFSPLPMC